MSPVIERVSPDDLMQLACDVGPVPMNVGAVLVLESGPGFDVAAAQEVIAERIAAIPRLRQKLVRAPPGCGRPIWTDDRAFDIRRHVRSVTCEPPGDEDALLETAVAIATQPLPLSRPLWSATFVTGLSGDSGAAGPRTALVVVFHHVLADGIGGLAVLAGLVDGAPIAPPAPFPRPVPSRRQLAADALRARSRAFARPMTALRTLRAAIAELNPGGARAAKTTLNRPTGPARRIMVTRCDLARVRTVAHAHGATVNDAVLAAVTRALHRLLADRGERLDDLVVSVPVTARATAAATQLGNRIGVMPVRLTVCGDRIEQLVAVAAATSAQKTASRGASAAVLRPAFRALAALGVLLWLINRQRLIHVFVTNVRGPGERQRFAGVPVSEVLPVTTITGNVTVSFAVMSYAGTLTVMIIADPRRHPDLAVLAAKLQEELDGLARDGSAASIGASG
ncbi:MAG: wax ester/triacylglycerol synthase domain-containing protein [Micromonosporaceae bacterium]